MKDILIDFKDTLFAENSSFDYEEESETAILFYKKDNREQVVFKVKYLEENHFTVLCILYRNPQLTSSWAYSVERAMSELRRKQIIS